MELTDENRILVKEGLKELSGDPLPGIRALTETCGLGGRKLSAYHLGFVLGPCFNAAGRLETVDDVYRLLAAGTEEEARPLAEKLRRSRRRDSCFRMYWSSIYPIVTRAWPGSSQDGLRNPSTGHAL